MGPTRKLSALVVDDELSLVRVIEGYLTKDGFDVRTYGWRRRDRARAGARIGT